MGRRKALIYTLNSVRSGSGSFREDVLGGGDGALVPRNPHPADNWKSYLHVLRREFLSWLPPLIICSRLIVIQVNPQDGSIHGVSLVPWPLCLVNMYPLRSVHKPIPQRWTKFISAKRITGEMRIGLSNISLIRFPFL